MAWTRALVYVVTAVLLAIVYFTATPTPRHAPAADPAAAASPEAPHMAIDTVRVEADGRTVGARRARDQWQVVDPPGAAVPSDLIEALVSAVLDTPAVPVAGDGQRPSDFGLDAPSARVIFGRPGGTPVTLTLGGTNPAATGVYGRLDGNPQIILVGLNVRYYIDLVLRQAKG